MGVTGTYLNAKDKIYVFRDLDGFSPGISRIVFMLDYARRTTLEAVKGLTQEQLDVQVLKNGNTIGMLLAHMAGVEESYQSVTFRGVQPPNGLPEHELGELGHETFRGYNLEHYLEKLATVRENTLLELRQRDDAWLHKKYAPWGGEPMNNFFCWFHVAEDEINHRGQIRILRKQIEGARVKDS